MVGYTTVNGVADAVNGHSPDLEFTVSALPPPPAPCSNMGLLTSTTDVLQRDQQQVDFNLCHSPRY